MFGPGREVRSFGRQRRSGWSVRIGVELLTQQARQADHAEPAAHALQCSPARDCRKYKPLVQHICRICLVHKNEFVGSHQRLRVLGPAFAAFATEELHAKLNLGRRCFPAV